MTWKPQPSPKLLGTDLLSPILAGAKHVNISGGLLPSFAPLELVGRKVPIVDDFWVSILFEEGCNWST